MRGLPMLQRVALAYKALMKPFDQRSAEAAHGLLGGIFSGSTGPAPARGTVELLNTFNDSPWVRACAGRVADSFSGVTWTIKAVKGKNDLRARSNVGWLQKAGPSDRSTIYRELKAEGSLIEVRQHLLLDAMRNGNQIMSGADLRWLMILYYDLVGDVFLIRQRNSQGKGEAYWIVPPHWIAETPTPKRPSFRANWRAWQTYIPQEDMLWIKNPNPIDPYERGSSMLRSLDDELAADEYAAKHQLKFFRNSARPDLLIMPTKDGQPFSEPDADRFEQWWNDKLQGYWRSFKPLFLKTAVDVKVLEQNFRNLQLTELRKHERDTITQAWGIPPEMFGIIASSNRSTIDMAPYIFAKYCLVPRIEKFRSFFQRVLETEYDNRLILDYISPVPSDKTFALEAIKAQPTAFKKNEVRVLAEMEPLDELGDEFGQSGAAPAADPNNPDQQGQPKPPEPKLQNLSDNELVALYALQKKLYYEQAVR